MFNVSSNTEQLIETKHVALSHFTFLKSEKHFQRRKEIETSPLFQKQLQVGNKYTK